MFMIFLVLIPLRLCFLNFNLQILGLTLLQLWPGSDWCVSKWCSSKWFIWTWYGKSICSKHPSSEGAYFWLIFNVFWIWWFWKNHIWGYRQLGSRKNSIQPQGITVSGYFDYLYFSFKQEAATYLCSKLRKRKYERKNGSNFISA